MYGVWNNRIRKTSEKSDLKTKVMTTGDIGEVTVLVKIVEVVTSSQIWSPTGLDKSDLNGEVTILQRVNVLFFALWNTIWDLAWLTLMVR